MPHRVNIGGAKSFRQRACSGGRPHAFRQSRGRQRRARRSGSRAEQGPSRRAAKQKRRSIANHLAEQPCRVYPDIIRFVPRSLFFTRGILPRQGLFLL